MANQEPKEALRAPKHQDPRWHDRIELAKIAREQGRKAREGKSVVRTTRRKTS